MDLTTNTGYGCAVGPYQVVTTSENTADAAYINIRRWGQNELIPARVRVVDYESNLCLLELDRNAAGEPLEGKKFSTDYEKGSAVDFFWLTGDGKVQSGRGYVDRADLFKTPLSFTRFLNVVIGNMSQRGGQGQLFCYQQMPIGISCWHDSGDNESGMIPAEVINKFLADASDGDYQGFPLSGFSTVSLLDPTLRDYLKMPPDLKKGVYVKDVYHLGTGRSSLEPNDVILAIEQIELDAYGRFDDPRFGEISYEQIISSQQAGDNITFHLWRDGKEVRLDIPAESFNAEDMLVPYYEFDKQSQYVLVGGYVLQQLTGKYLRAWGDGWTGKVDPHLFHYYRDLAFKPEPDRQEIVILSMVLPDAINLGYQGLRQRVVKSYNGREIGSVRDIIDARQLNPDDKFDVITFENNNPTVVIPRDQLVQANMMIARTYGIPQTQHIEE
ncbi:MAG: hypothetical protein JW860_07880 [Sedimentisphaerales bacterium]|nr:hypothetical protein [Sedimentisphaerales bacterium]